MAKTTKKMPFRVGVVGESSYDTRAMRDLLERQYGGRAQFMDMGLRLAGGQFDGKKSQTMFKLRYEAKQPDLVIIFRDLDGPADDKEMRRKREVFFADMNALVGNKGLFLVHVYTIEALLIAHIEVFQQKFGWQCRVPANPTTIPRPTQFLRDASRNSRCRYDKASCPDMMALVAYPFLTKRCRYFAAFDAAFDAAFAARLPPLP